MADYTSTEITTAVEKVVNSAIRRPYGVLGNRDVQTTFSDLQAAVASLFILNPNAPFYVVDLGTLRTVELLEAIEETLDSLIDNLENSARNTTEISNLAPLANARSALAALSTAAANRTGTFQSIEDVPAWKRYNSNAQRFLDTASQNSLKNGVVVPTPRESKDSIGGLVRTLTEQMEDLTSRVGFLQSSIDDYDALNLPASVSLQVMQSARQVLDDRVSELEGLTPADRLGLIRDVTLDILAGRAAVTGLGSLKQTTVFAQIEGVASVFADADHPATPAEIRLDDGPYPIYPAVLPLEASVLPTSATTMRFTLSGPSWAAVGARVGDFLQVVEGLNNGARYKIDDLDIPLGDLNATLVSGPAPLAELSIDVLLSIDALELDFTLDDSFTFTTAAPTGFLAFANSGFQEPYNITAAVNDTLIVQADGFAPVVIVLPVGPALTAATVAAVIDAALSPVGLECVEVLTGRRFEGAVSLDATGSPSDMDFILPSPSTWEATGAREGDLVKILNSITGQVNAEYTVDVGGIAGNTLTCTNVFGALPADEIGLSAVITTGVGKTIRIKIKTGREKIAMISRQGFVFPNNPANTSISPAVALPFTPSPSLGFILGGVVRSRGIDSQTLVNVTTQAFGSQQLGQPRLDGEVVLTGETYLGRTNPDDPVRMTVYKFRERGDVSAGGPVGVVFSGLSPDQSVEVGDVVVIRETGVQLDQGAFGLVTAVGSTSITADLDRAVGSASDILVEVGPNLVLTSEYQDFRVTGSTSHNGDYTMEFEGHTPFPAGIPFDFVLEQPIPVPRNIGGQPFFFNTQVGLKHAVFRSVDTTLATKIRLFDSVSGRSAVPNVAAAHPLEEVGNTTWLQLPGDPKSLAVNDVIELHETVVSSPSRSFSLESLELDLLLIELSTGLETDFGSINMGLNSPVPFGRIRLGRKNTFAALEESLDIWLKLDAVQATWLRELGRLLNPILVNKRPTILDVNTAVFHVKQLLGVLTAAGAAVTGGPAEETLETYLNSYTSTPVSDVDTLVEAYLSRGSDRGIDILLQGRFTEFFGLTTESLSHDGHFREQVRAIMRDDLPVSKLRRGLRYDVEQDEGTWEDADAEFDFSDTDDLHENVEIPGDFDEVLPPGV